MSVPPGPLGGSQVLLSLRIAGLRVGAWAWALLFRLARGLLSLLPGAPRHLQTATSLQQAPTKETTGPRPHVSARLSQPGGWACPRPCAWCLATLPPGLAAWPCVCSFPAQAICAGTACQESLEGRSPACQSAHQSAPRSTGGAAVSSTCRSWQDPSGCGVGWVGFEPLCWHKGAPSSPSSVDKTLHASRGPGPGPLECKPRGDGPELTAGPETREP